MRSWKPIGLGVTLALSSQFSWAAVIETIRLVGFGKLNSQKSLRTLIMSTHKLPNTAK